MKRHAVSFRQLLEHILPVAALPAADRERVERALAQGSPAEQEAVAVAALERLADAGTLVPLPDRLEGGDRVVRWQKKDAQEVIALGKPCSTTFKVGTYHYLVNRADVTFTMTPRSTNLVTKCERR